MAVPQGYSVRAPRADEAAGVATIFEAYDVSQFDALDTSATELEEVCTRPRSSTSTLSASTGRTPFFCEFRGGAVNAPRGVLRPRARTL
jgi:hypothetical protein